MNRFILQKSDKPNHLVCTDTKTGIVCVFEEHSFNDTQKVTILDEGDLLKNPNAAQVVAAALREMGGWLHKNHYQKIF